MQAYLPGGVTGPSRNGEPITLEHLATQTSGLPLLDPAVPLRMPASRQPTNGHD